VDEPYGIRGQQLGAVVGILPRPDQILEGEFISQLVGYPDARLHIVYLGIGDMKHAVELIQYLNPVGGITPIPERNQVGGTHLGIIVDDLDRFYTELTSKGVRFVNPPAIRPVAPYPMARKGCYAQDPDGNCL
jgi:catechol 2,3-dioxygenase-like lactoylglutathione lyase family enzyme